MMWRLDLTSSVPQLLVHSDILLNLMSNISTFITKQLASNIWHSANTCKYQKLGQFYRYLIISSIQSVMMFHSSIKDRQIVHLSLSLLAIIYILFLFYLFSQQLICIINQVLNDIKVITWIFHLTIDHWFILRSANRTLVIRQKSTSLWSIMTYCRFQRIQHLYVTWLTEGRINSKSSSPAADAMCSVGVQILSHCCDMTVWHLSVTDRAVDEDVWVGAGGNVLRPVLTGSSTLNAPTSQKTQDYISWTGSAGNQKGDPVIRCTEQSILSEKKWTLICLYSCYRITGTVNKLVWFPLPIQLCSNYDCTPIIQPKLWDISLILPFFGKLLKQH